MRRLIVAVTLVLILPALTAYAQESRPPIIPPHLEPITANNIHRLERIAVLGFGLVQGLNWSSDGHILATNGTSGVWLYSPDNPGYPYLLRDTEVEPWMQQTRSVLSEDDLMPYRDLTEADEWEIAFSPDQTLFAAVEEEETRIWNLPDRPLVATLSMGKGYYAGGLTISANDERLAAGVFNDQDNGTTLRVWDIRYGQEIAVLDEVHFGVILRSAFDSTGTWLAAVDINNNVSVWNVETGALNASFYGHVYGISSMTFSPDGTQLASGGWLSGIRLWDVTTGQQVKVFHYGNDVRAITFIDNEILFFTGDCGQLTGWNIVTEERVVDLGCKTSGRAAFSRDGQWLVGSWESNEMINVWDVTSDTLITDLTGHTERVTATAFSPNGLWLASGSRDGTIWLWDTQTWTAIASMAEHDGAVRALAFSPDSRLLISASEDGTARLWYIGQDSTTYQPGTQLAILYTNQQQSRLFVFSADGRMLVTSACLEACSLVFWDVASVQSVRVIQMDDLGYVTFNPEGTLLAISTNRGSIELWGVPVP